MNNPLLQLRTRWTRFMVEQRLQAIKKELSPTRIWEGEVSAKGQPVSPWLREQLLVLAQRSPKALRQLEDEMWRTSQEERWEELRMLGPLLEAAKHRAKDREPQEEHNAQNKSRSSQEQEDRRRWSWSELFLQGLTHPVGFVAFQGLALGAGLVGTGTSVVGLLLRVPLVVVNVGVTVHLCKSRHIQPVRNWTHWMRWVDDRRDCVGLPHNKNSLEAALRFHAFWTQCCAAEERKILAKALDKPSPRFGIQSLRFGIHSKPTPERPAIGRPEPQRAGEHPSPRLCAKFAATSTKTDIRSGAVETIARHEGVKEHPRGSETTFSKEPGLGGRSPPLNATENEAGPSPRRSQDECSKSKLKGEGGPSSGRERRVRRL